MKKNLIHFLFFSSLVVLFSGCVSMKAERTESPFEYREIYLAETMGKKAAAFGLNTVDNDWGIWGHNLDVVVPRDPSQTIYAKINGETDHDQFCFSSNHLFTYICDYIDDNYSPSDSIRFAILPNDNEIVCLCQRCVTAGNTKGNASPAVIKLIRRLCERYPSHTFFTSYYSTTSELPDEKLPANSGVLLSAMGYPRVNADTPGEAKFEELVKLWSDKVNKVYVWDYINNFDDYFTPIPVFDVMQRRFQLYERAGVDGIFLNGSGTDYSAMSSLKAKVLAELSEDPDADWRPVLRAVSNEEFPLAGETIADFMIAQEDYAKAQNKDLPMYDGIKAELNSYLPGQDFISFYNNILDIRRKATGNEKLKLDTLAAALSLPRLELARLSGNLEGSDEAIALLSTFIDSPTEFYSEGSWLVERYVKDIKYARDHARKYQSQNLLKGMTIKPHEPLDEDYTDISIITDGLLGIPSNYHAGNLIYSAPSLSLTVPYVEGMKQLRVGFARNRQYRIGLPVKVTLYHDGKPIGSVVPAPENDHPGHGFAVFDIPESVHGPMTLTITRDPEIHSMAIDEIEAI